MSHQKCPKKAALIRHQSYHKLKISIPLLGCDLTSTSGNSVCVCVGGGGGRGKLCLYGNIRWNVSSKTPRGGGSNKKSQLPQTQKINTPLWLCPTSTGSNSVYVGVGGTVSPWRHMLECLTRNASVRWV